MHQRQFNEKQPPQRVENRLFTRPVHRDAPFTTLCSLIAQRLKVPNIARFTSVLAAASLEIFLITLTKMFLLWRVDNFWLPRRRRTGVDLAVIACEKIQHAGDDADDERSANCRPEA